MCQTVPIVRDSEVGTSVAGPGLCHLVLGAGAVSAAPGPLSGVKWRARGLVWGDNAILQCPIRGAAADSGVPAGTDACWAGPTGPDRPWVLRDSHGSRDAPAGARSGESTCEDELLGGVRGPTLERQSREPGGDCRYDVGRSAAHQGLPEFVEAVQCILRGRHSVASVLPTCNGSADAPADALSHRHIRRDHSGCSPENVIPGGHPGSHGARVVALRNRRRRGSVHRRARLRRVRRRVAEISTHFDSRGNQARPWARR